MDRRGLPKRVTVVIPAHNAAATIGEQLDALARQAADLEWEVVVVDDGSTDTTIDIVHRFRERVPGLRVATTSERHGAPHARNVGASSARGDFLAFCDADDVVGTGWVTALVAAAPNGDLVGGRVDDVSLNDGAPPRPPVQPGNGLHRSHGFLPYAPSCNVGVWTETFNALGGWREDYTGGYEDVEFCWRAQLAGHTLVYAPDAVIHYRHRRSVRGLARQYYAYGMRSAQLYRDYRDVGMPASHWRVAAGGVARLVRQLPAVLRAGPDRARWVRKASFRAGRLVGSVRWRVLFP